MIFPIQGDFMDPIAQEITDLYTALVDLLALYDKLASGKESWSPSETVRMNQIRKLVDDGRKISVTGPDPFQKSEA